MPSRSRLVATGVFCLLFGSAGAASHLGVPTIIDAQTVKIEGRTFQLAGIEAPGLMADCRGNTKAETCGEQAARALRGLIRSRPIRCDTEEEGARLAVCYVGGRELAAELVATGYGRASDGRYADFEEHARLLGAGFWANGDWLIEAAENR